MTTRPIPESQVDQRAVNNRIRGMKLLPQEIRKKLPPLYSQDGKGGEAVVHLRLFTPDSSWTWLITYAELSISEVMWSKGLCRAERFNAEQAANRDHTTGTYSA